MLGGYENTAAWYNIHSKGVDPQLGKYSPAGLYRALHRYADGYPDPRRDNVPSFPPHTRSRRYGQSSFIRPRKTKIVRASLARRNRTQ